MIMDESAATGGLPDMKISVRQVFGIDSDMEAPAYSSADPHVPDIDPDYLFDRDTTLAILAGFAIMAPANRPISSRSRRG
jgi:cobaltochelatase CobS